MQKRKNIKTNKKLSLQFVFIVDVSWPNQTRQWSDRSDSERFWPTRRTDSRRADDRAAIARSKAWHDRPPNTRHDPIDVRAAVATRRCRAIRLYRPYALSTRAADAIVLPQLNLRRS
jgi:hypothetical protein